MLAAPTPMSGDSSVLNCKGGVMTEPSDRRLAQATLVGMRATLPLPYEAYRVALGKSWYRLLPQRAVLDEEQMLAALVDTPKPALCAALALDGIVAVAAWPQTARWSPEISRELRAEAERSAPSNPNARLLLKADGAEPVILTADEFYRWREQYDILGLNLAWATSGEDAVALAHGATNTVHLSRVQPTTARIIAGLEALATQSGFVPPPPNDR